MSVQQHPTKFQDQIAFLKDYSACDVADALLKIQEVPGGKVPRAGYLTDIVPFAPTSPFQGDASQQPKVIAPASTLRLIKKSPLFFEFGSSSEGAIPKAKHWVDMADEGSIVVIEQPEGQHCAAIGGIMAQRMKILGVLGCVVGGRVRDLAELKDSGLPVFAMGRSIVSTSAESLPVQRNVPITVMGITISPGDILFCDPLEGVVVIPASQLEEVIELMPKLVVAVDNVKAAVAEGMTVAEAFKKFRG